MTIGVDARVLSSKPRGIGRFLADLLRESVRDHTNTRFVLFVDRALDASAADLAGHCAVRVRVLAVRRGYRWNLWHQLVLPLAARASRVDVLYGPANSVPCWQPVPCVVTVHDTKFLRAPRTILGRGFADGGRLLPSALRRAAHVVTASEFTRRDLLTRVDVHPARVSVVYQGIGDRFRPLPTREAASAEVESAYGVRTPYLFALGAEASDKNTAALVEAARLLRVAHGVKIHLVVAGIQDRALPAFRRLVETYGIAPYVTLLGYVEDETLVRLYNGATLFVYPQLDEGFGRPPLEAMACGTPVVVSNRSSIPEVTGGAAILADASEPGRLAAALGVALERVGRGERAELVARGLARAAEFSWARAARAYMAVFRSSVGR